MTEFRIYRGHLPHWRFTGATYFVTWRLDEKQPALQPDEQNILVNAFKYFDNIRYTLIAYVIMDDHIHLIIEPLDDWQLEKLVYSWKRYTSTRINRISSRVSPVWQREYYDHVIRNRDDMDEKLGYLLTNPQRKWQDVIDYKWLYLRE